MAGDIDNRREDAEEAIILGLLDAVDGNAAVTQRHLAQELGIALGLANTYLKRCVRKGLLKVAQVPTRRYAYYVTPQGFAEKSRLTARYLAVSFDFLRRSRNEFADLFGAAQKQGQTRFLLIGEGDLADVATLVAQRSGITISAVLPAQQTPAVLARALASIEFDVAVITATEYPQETYAAAVSALGADRVRAPALLRIKAGSRDLEPLILDVTRSGQLDASPGVQARGDD